MPTMKTKSTEKKNKLNQETAQNIGIYYNEVSPDNFRISTWPNYEKTVVVNGICKQVGHNWSTRTMTPPTLTLYIWTNLNPIMTCNMDFTLSRFRPPLSHSGLAYRAAGVAKNVERDLKTRLASGLLKTPAKESGLLL